METIFNFNLDRIREINMNGMAKYKEGAKNRKENEKLEKLVLDTNDLLILKFIVGVGSSDKAIKEKGNESFFWVNYNALLNEYNGLLFLSKSALQVRLNKYVMMGLVERKCIKNEEGSFSFFKLTGIVKLIVSKESNQDKVVSTESVEEKLQKDCNITHAQAKEVIEYAKNQGAKKPYSYAKTVIQNGYFEKNRAIGKSNNKFNDFPQREYTKAEFDEIERKLLSIQWYQ